MRHKLTTEILTELKTAGVKPTPAMRAAFKLLDGMATRASNAGQAAAGSSGRPKADVDVDEVRRLWHTGMRGTAIARQLGVSQPTISRIIRGVR